MDKSKGFISLALFVCSIFLANFLISQIGTICLDDGPCMIPVWPGIMAPSGVLAIGLGFTLRDLVHRYLGVWYALLGVVIGSVLSGVLSPSLALASGLAFLFSEMLDLLVYVPLQKRGLVLAVIGSNIFGLVTDSIIFLWLAFGGLDFLLGQVIGKAWMTLLALPLIWIIRRWDNA